ncbi:hypothetical protein DV735_g2442, partial [Chaetothyriales sp. CBS 134920]
MDVEHPRPAKKRRFFVDDSSDANDSTPRTTYSAPSEQSQEQEEQKLRADKAGARGRSDEVVTFDVGALKAIVGDDVSPEIAQRLSDAANGNLERAINMYFDGSWKTAAVPSRPSHVNVLLAQPSPQQKAAKSFEKKQNVLKGRMQPQDRYIGCFGVEGWTTKSGTNILAHGEAVRIERTKIAPKTKVGRGGKIMPVVAGRSSQKHDIVTRFTNLRGEELGRLSGETARWVSTLLDQKICRFEATCVYAPERVRTNDTIVLQLRAYLLRTAFESHAFVKPQDDNRAISIFGEKESLEEKDLRLRQVALVKLFDEVNLHPSTANPTTARHKKQGLLKAAEMAEQYDKDKALSLEENEDGVELEDDQLDALYQKAQAFDFDAPEAEPASSFVLSLRTYQKQALHWMLAKEKDEKSGKQASLHPLWEEYTWPTKDGDDKPLPVVAGQDKFYVNLYSGEVSLDFPVQEQNCLGGILADEMGLGKTIEVYSLIHTHKPDTGQTRSSSSAVAGLVNGLSQPVEPEPITTLVVAPMSLLAQWESEAAKSSKAGSLRTLVYYGTDKSVNLQTLCSPANARLAPHVIITSYGTVLSEFNRVSTAGGERSGLFSVDFFRIILDEAHTIKNRLAKTSKACYELKGKHRWVLTGTPIVNRLEDLFSLVRFLRVEPWSNFSFWKTFITVPFESKEFVRALNVVQTVLEPLVLRRTKDMKTADGEALVPLPPRTIKVEEIELSQTEREVYDLILTRAKRTFNESLAAGTLLKSYTTLFAQILRLRQSCCHPVLTRNQEIVADEEDKAVAAAADPNGFADDMDLQELIGRFTKATDAADKENAVADKEDRTSRFTTHALRQIQTESSGECPICAEEPMINPAVTACWHSACKACLENFIKHQTDKHEQPRCFSCRETIDPRDVFEVVKHASFSDASADREDEDMYGSAEVAKQARISLRRIRPYSPSAATSAKIAALLNHLSALPRGTKSVVFSQFASFLDLISPQLKRHGFEHLRFDGSLSQKARSQVLREFNAENAHEPKAPKVLLLSLRAGGVGLNLTAASRCFMMDPWWSFAVEAQAIDRVHRMGQTQRVEVIRFVTKDSIEGRMLQIQERKMAVAGTVGLYVGEELDEHGFRLLRDAGAFLPKASTFSHLQLFTTTWNNQIALKAAQDEYMAIAQDIDRIKGTSGTVKDPQALADPIDFEESKEAALYGYKYEAPKPCLFSAGMIGGKLAEEVSEVEKRDVRLVPDPFAQGGFIPNDRQYKGRLLRAKDKRNPDGWTPIYRDGKALIPRAQKHHDEYTGKYVRRAIDEKGSVIYPDSDLETEDSVATPSKTTVNKRLTRTRFAGRRVPSTRDGSEARSVSSTPSRKRPATPAMDTKEATPVPKRIKAGVHLSWNSDKPKHPNQYTKAKEAAARAAAEAEAAGIPLPVHQMPDWGAMTSEELKARKWTDNELRDSLAKDHTWLHPDPAKALEWKDKILNGINPVRSWSMVKKWAEWRKDNRDKRPRKKELAAQTKGGAAARGANRIVEESRRSRRESTEDGRGEDSGDTPRRSMRNR